MSDRSSALPRTSLTTAADALRDEEVERTRGFIRIGWAIAVGAILAVFALPGDRQLAKLLVLAIAVTAALSVVAYRTLTSVDALRSPFMTALALACTTCGVIANLYCGFFGGAPLMLALGVYFFCRTEQQLAAVAMLVLVAGSHAVLAVLIMSGTIADPGFAPLRPTVNIQAQLAGIGCAMFGYGMAFWLARSTRAASLRVIEELQKTTRLAAARLAQLDEARDDLDRALKVGGPGQFTRAVVGSWELGHVLGRGGMGEVYEATHVDTDAPAAVKMLRRELLTDKMHVERFLREVRAASALDSPHVVRTLEASRPDDPIPFLAMERLRGDTLSGMLRGGGLLDRALVIELVQQLARVLELARAANLVHRDIKPANIFRSDEGMWKLLDFGVAVLGDSSGTLTQGGVIGTPGYMAPEQAKGETVDHRADIYAVGAVVYRCVTGRVPFAGPDQAALLYAMVHDPPIRASALASLPTDVDRVLAIALAKKPADRFATALELADALTAAFGEQLPARLRSRADAMLRVQPWREVDTSATEKLAR